MPIIATGSQTIIDLSDGKSLSVYLGTNQPRTQILDVNAGTYSPDWSTTAGKLVITPVVYANQTAIELTDKALAITWKRKEGSASEAALGSGETVSGNILTVSANKIGSTGLLTYLAYVTYTDPDTGLPINAVSEISFAQVQTGQNAKNAWISGEQVFKYTSAGAVSPAQIALTANLQNVTMVKWQYKNSEGAWTDYPTTSDNASITGTTLIVKPTHAIFVGSVATLRILTSDGSIGDTTSVYKVQDGANGGTGAAGQNARIAFLTNENVTFAGDKSGQVAATTVTCNVVAYNGTTKVTPTVGTVTGAPTGMTVSKGSAVNNEIPITLTIAAGATLGGAGQLSGTLSVPVTAPVATTLQIHWSKVNTGATGAAGASAVTFTIYAPNGTVFVNGSGTLTIATQAYQGSTAITSGATYVWKKYSGGSWSTISGQTGSSLSVAGSTVTGMASYQCVMTYGGKTYQDVITLTDKTDNYQAGAEAAHRLAELMGGSGQAALLVHSSETETGIERERGFREELEQNYPDIEIVSAAYQNQDERSVDDIVAAVFYEYPELKAYQAMNEETTEALISAIEMYGPEDRTILTAGFDASSAEMKDIEDGKLAGVIAQNPYGMGYAAAVSAFREIAGMDNADLIDTGYLWITAGNLGEPAAQQLIYK